MPGRREAQGAHTPGRIVMPVLLQHDLAVAKGEKGKLVFGAVVLDPETQHITVEIQTVLQVRNDQFRHQGVQLEHALASIQFLGRPIYPGSLSLPAYLALGMTCH